MEFPGKHNGDQPWISQVQTETLKPEMASHDDTSSPETDISKGQGYSGHPQNGFRQTRTKKMEGLGVFKSTSALSTRFGALKVYASLLSAEKEFKTYVVTNMTSAMELINIVISSYQVITDDITIFTLLAEKTKNNTDDRPSIVQPEEKPLELQAKYMKQDTRFTLKVRQSVAVVTACLTLTTGQKAQRTTRSVFLTEAATCRTVLELMLDTCKISEYTNNYELLEVNYCTKESHLVDLARHPAEIQSEWLDPHECYFEVRPRSDHDPQIRRTSSLGSIEQEKPNRLLNIREVRKTLLPKRTRGKKNSQPNDVNSKTLVTSNGSESKGQDSSRKQTVTRLKSSLVKLKDHLDSLQKKKKANSPGCCTNSTNALPKNPEETVHCGDFNALIESSSALVEDRRGCSTESNGFGESNSSVSNTTCDVTINSRINKDLIGSEEFVNSDSIHADETEVYFEHGGVDNTVSDKTHKLRHSLPDLSAHLIALRNRSTTYCDLSRAGVYVPQPFCITKQATQSNLTLIETEEASPSSVQDSDISLHYLTEGGHVFEEDSNAINTTQEEKMSGVGVIRPEPLRPIIVENNNYKDAAYDTINEGDSAGEDSNASSNRGTNDSAYASDRTNYNTPLGSANSAFSRRFSYSSDDPILTDQNTKIFKSQSLLELQTLPSEFKPRTRILSASSSQAKVRLKKKNSELTGSDNHLSLWDQHTLPKPNMRRSLSMQITSPLRNRPNSADSSRSNTSSGRNSSGKRRALPQVPQANQNIEERVKRIQAVAVKKVQSRKEREQQKDKREKVEKIERLDTPPRPVEMIEKVEKIPVEDDNDGYGSDESEFVKEVDLDSRGPTPLKTGLESYYEELSNDATPSVNDLSDYASYDSSSTPVMPVEERQNGPQNFTARPFNRSKPRSPEVNGGSQVALQRIIDDLKDASLRPYESSSGSHTSPSSGSSKSREQQYFPFDYSQLARWGIIEPSVDDLDNQYALPRRSNSISSGPTAPELKVLHPSIFKIAKSCELVTVVLDRINGDRSSDFGLQIFESVFSDQEGKQKGRRPIFRSPSGRRPILGRRKGAFQRVTNTSDGGIILSLIAVDEIRKDGSARHNRVIMEGDYFVEVNGQSVIDVNVERVRSELSRSGDRVELVLARPKLLDSEPQSSQTDMRNSSSAEQNKEFEKLKLKYSALKQESERNSDNIAELKLDLKDREEGITTLSKEIYSLNEQLQSLSKITRKKEEEVNEWKYEANHRNVELARLKFETKQKSDRITQLRRLLIQQTELLQMQGLSSNSAVLEEAGEHVSAV